MRVRLNLTLDFAGGADELRERLLAWGLRGGFHLAEEKPDRWVLRRGSQWGSLFVFTDVHALYCEVEALHQPLHRQIVVCLECSSWFHVATPGDRGKLEQELNLLRAFLVGDVPRERWADGTRPPSRGITGGDEAIEK